MRSVVALHRPRRQSDETKVGVRKRTNLYRLGGSRPVLLVHALGSEDAVIEAFLAAFNAEELAA
jgi:hypothetical protein